MVDTFRIQFLDALVAEQVIDPPKILLEDIRMVERLRDLLPEPGRVDQTVGIPVPGSGGRYLRVLLPGQSSFASAKLIVDNPVPRGRRTEFNSVFP